MQSFDWIIVGLYLVLSLGIGLYFSRQGGSSVADYFVSGRNLSWWIIGISAAATYSDAGLAPAITMLTYQGGLLGNAVWWIPFAIWMPLGAVLWSKYWRRLGTVTSAELLNIRYSGKLARVYRGMYAFFMSFGFTVILMGYMSSWLGAALSSIVGWSYLQLILIAGLATVIITTASGLSGVAYTQAYQFAVFLSANVVLVFVALADLGGMTSLHHMIMDTRGPAGASFFQIAPPSPGLDALTIFAFVVQGLFFAASPSGGEGFTAQRFMAARNEFHAQVGQLLSTVLTLIVRVVPFLFLGMIAAALFRVGSVEEPGELWARLVHMYAPAGLMGLIVAGVFAAYMGGVGAQMNWGASYIVNDLYRPFLRRNQSEMHYVRVGRLGSILLFALSVLVAYFLVHGLRSWFLFINSVFFAFVLPLSWLRFFWWRLNIQGEIAALAVGLPLSYLIWFPLGFSNESVHPFWHGFLLLFGLGFALIIVVTYLFPPESTECLRDFYLRCRPPGLWRPINRANAETRREIRHETIRDLIDCLLGILMAGGSIVAVISIMAGRWGIFAAAVIAILAAGRLFVVRWRNRGVFRGLSETMQDQVL